MPEARFPPKSSYQMADNVQEDRKRKDEAVRATIMQKLIETGEKER